MSISALHETAIAADSSFKRLGSMPRASAVAGALLMCGLVLLIYLPSLRGEFIIDDDRYLTENPLISSPNGLYGFWFTRTLEYYPVSNSSLWMEWRLWELNPVPYRITHLILHLATCLLLWVVLRKLSIVGAFLAALLFAIHPINVQTVAWISQRKEILAAFFFVLSILWYLRDEEQVAANKNRSLFHTGRWYWLSLMAFVLSILSKGTVGTLPLVLVLIVWWQYRRITRGDIARLLPFFCVGFSVSLLHVWWQMHGDPIAHASFGERLAGAGAVVWFYLSKACLPINLDIIYPHWQIRIDDLRWWLPLLAALGISALLWHDRDRKWISPLFLAWVYFCLALAPVLGFAETGGMRISLVADHYQHLALIGVCALVASGCYKFSELITARRWAKIRAVVLVGLLIPLAWQRSWLFGHPIFLFQDSVAKDPESWLAHTNLGIALTKAGRIQDAAQQFQQALRLKPTGVESYKNLGVALLNAGQLRQAIDCFERLLQIRPDDNGTLNSLGTAYFNLGNSFLQAGRWEESIGYYRQALRARPEYSEAHYNLGIAMAQTGDMNAAIAQFEQTLELKPDFAEAHNNLGNALLALGRPEEAVAHYQEALRLKPQDAASYVNLMKAYDQLHRQEEAVAAAKKGLETARANGQSALAKQIDDWLSSYRTLQTEAKDNSVPSEAHSAQ